jgi:serine/threonine-protein kinase
VHTLTAGQHLSHYHVISPLGAGGMGEVYLAEDMRLGRKVALKILARALTANPDRVNRFRQEARTISALNHPNILTVYDVGAVHRHRVRRRGDVAAANRHTPDR